MKNSSVVVLLSALVLPLCAALVVQSFAARTRRSDICRSQDTALDVLHDVLVIAMTPPKGRKLSTKQVRAIAIFETKAFARIDSAKC